LDKCVAGAKEAKGGKDHDWIVRIEKLTQAAQAAEVSKIREEVRDCYVKDVGKSLEQLREHIFRQIPKLAFGEEGVVGASNLLEYTSGRRRMSSLSHLVKEIFTASQDSSEFRKAVFGRAEDVEEKEEIPRSGTPSENSGHRYADLHECLVVSLELMTRLQFLSRVDDALTQVESKDLTAEQALETLEQRRQFPVFSDHGWPELLVFELMAGNFFLRKLQVETIEKFVGTEKISGFQKRFAPNNSIQEVQAGGGKTKVIFPLVAAFNSVTLLSIVVFTRPLFPTNRVDLRRSIGLLGRRTRILELGRRAGKSSSLLLHARQLLEDARVKGEVVVTTANSLLCILNIRDMLVEEHTEVAQELKKMKREMERAKQQLEEAEKQLEKAQKQQDPHFRDLETKVVELERHLLRAEQQLEKTEIWGTDLQSRENSIIGMEQVIKDFGAIVVDESDSQMDLTQAWSQCG